MGVREELESQSRQLENKREHLLLIQERKSEYILDTDVPLELIKEERETEQEIAELEARVEALRKALAEQGNQPVRSIPTGQPVAKPAPRARKGALIFGAGGLATCLLVTVIAILFIKGLTGGQKGISNDPRVIQTEKPAAFQPTLAENPIQLSKDTASPSTGKTPSPTSGAAFAPATLTPTSPPPPAVNLTNNPDGRYDRASLLFDAKGILHLVFYSRLPRGGDYYHQQLSSQGVWTAPESYTGDFNILWSNLVLARNPSGSICILWSGVSTKTGEGYYKSCQTLDGSLTPAEKWRPHDIDTRAAFSPLVLPDGSIASSFDRIAGPVQFKDQPVSDNIVSNKNSHLVQDTSGRFHLVWIRYGTPYSLDYRSSSDGGVTWSAEEKLTADANTPGIWFDLAAGPKDSLHLVWSGKGSFLYYRRWSPDQGWSEPVQISNCGVYPKITVNKNGLARVTASCSRGIVYIQQTPNGEWQAPYTIAPQGGGPPSIVVDESDHIHVVFYVNNDIYYTTFAAR